MGDDKDPGQPVDDPPAKTVNPAHDGPPEIEDAARQESEYPEDETGEG